MTQATFKTGDRVTVKLPHGNEPGMVTAVREDSVSVRFDDGQRLTIDSSFVVRSEE